MGSSFISVAMARVYGSAPEGKSKERARMADTPLLLKAGIVVLPRQGEPES